MNGDEGGTRTEAEGIMWTGGICGVQMPGRFRGSSVGTLAGKISDGALVGVVGTRNRLRVPGRVCHLLEEMCLPSYPKVLDYKSNLT